MNLNRFLRFGRRSLPKVLPALPPGLRVYAVGDIHGRMDLLDRLLAQVQADNGKRSEARTLVIMLGDLIDRGSDSRAVIERLRRDDIPGMQLIALRGNHEEILERILDGEAALIGNWLACGGSECLMSYGLKLKNLDGIDEVHALQIIKRAIPEEHQAFLQNLKNSFELGDYLFVHAGIRPGIPLSMQFQSDLRWIRSPFLESKAAHTRIVIHGHSISEEIEERINRIGLDTGAYRSGRLSALGLEGNARWYMEAIIEGDSPSALQRH